MTSDIWNMKNIDKECKIRENTPYVSWIETIAVDPSFVTTTKLLSSKTKETFLGMIEMNV